MNSCLIVEKSDYAQIDMHSPSYLKLGLGSAAEFGQDGEQRLVNGVLCKFITITLPALLKLLKASLTHGEQ